MFRGAQSIKLYRVYSDARTASHHPVASSEQIFAQSLFLPNKRKQKDIMDQSKCVKSAQMIRK